MKKELESFKEGLGGGCGEKAIPPPAAGGFSRQLVNVCLLVSF